MGTSSSHLRDEFTDIPHPTNRSKLDRSQSEEIKTSHSSVCTDVVPGNTFEAASGYTVGSSIRLPPASTIRSFIDFMPSPLERKLMGSDPHIYEQKDSILSRKNQQQLKTCDLHSGLERRNGSTLTTNFQFILVDLFEHLKPVARQMLQTLMSSSEHLKVIILSDSTFDFDKKPKKKTYLFVSTEFAVRIPKTSTYFERIIILEDDKTEVDYEERFNSDVDLIFELVDELYRCYKKEAQEDRQSDNSIAASVKEELAQKVHSSLKQIYKSVPKDNDIIMKPITNTIVTIWLNRNSQDEEKIEQIKQFISKNLSSSFLVFDNQFECEKYLIDHQSTEAIFLIISRNIDHSSDYDVQQQYPHVQNVYYFEKKPIATNENIIEEYDGLCFQLLADLAAYYDKLGSTYTDNNNLKLAKEIFVEAQKLYKKLSDFKWS